MKFYSTNKKERDISLEEAVLKGLASDGGIYMPDFLANFSKNFKEDIRNLSFNEIAYLTAKTFLGSSVTDEIISKTTLSNFTFKPELLKLDNNLYILELFHGPTLAFKDFGGVFMAKLISLLLKEKGEKLTILAATSGDTGSAVARGFYKMDNIDVVLLYPKGRVSFIQEQQLTTIGENVRALEVNGSFDDCQKIVKEAFSDKDLRAKINLSSANSINIARLIPQAFYYVYAYSQLMDLNKEIVFSVPSGNYGNLTAGLFAKKMGVPINKFIAASNQNSIVPDYLNGEEFSPKESIATISNAMDVGNPSNFARINDLYKIKEEMQNDISGFAIPEAETKASISSIYKDFAYTACPHTAVGVNAFVKYKEKSDFNGIGVCLATAHPAKFKDTVEEVLGVKVIIPERLANCLDKEKKSDLINADYQEFKKLLLRKNKN